MKRNKKIINLWKKTGLKVGDKNGLIELILRDVSMEDLNETFNNIDPDQELLEEEFIEAVQDKIEKWSENKLLIFWKNYSYK